MTMNRAQHPKAHVDRLYLKKCEGGRGLIRLEDCVQVEVPKYFQRDIKRRRSRIIENNKYGRSKGEIHKEYREKYERKLLHGQFRIATEKVRGKKSWNCLKCYSKKETESTIVAS